MDRIHSQTEDAAARAIQRVYRYHRVRNHFRDIVMLARAREGKIWLAARDARAGFAN